MPKRLPDHTSGSAAKPLLLILSGPSGVGKDSVLSRMKELKLPLHYVVTLTTRPRRANETDSLDYRFVAKTDFENLKDRNQLLESANVYGNWYGVPREDVEKALGSGKDTIVKVDVQGARNIKRIMPQAVSVFLRPASKGDLALRLQKRKSESALDLAVRLKAAEDEFERMPDFDYVVVNEWGQIDRAVDDISWVISVERCRPRRTDDG
jgi:guanylate kinase